MLKAMAAVVMVSPLDTSSLILAYLRIQPPLCRMRRKLGRRHSSRPVGGRQHRDKRPSASLDRGLLVRSGPSPTVSIGSCLGRKGLSAEWPISAIVGGSVATPEEKRVFPGLVHPQCYSSNQKSQTSVAHIPIKAGLVTPRVRADKGCTNNRRSAGFGRAKSYAARSQRL